MAASLGVLHLEVMVLDAMTLKDKRSVIKGFKDRTRSRYNVSVAEVGAQDSIRRSELAVAMIGSDRRYVEGAMQKVANDAERNRGMYVVSSEIELL